jgi:hypothetical protein
MPPSFSRHAASSSSNVTPVFQSPIHNICEYLKSKLGAAMTYLANQWDTLVVFLTDGRAALSNNHMENHIRPFAVGRKNWLFSDTVRGADASAMLYTIVATARANQIPVGTYLEWLLKELPKAEAKPRKGKLDLSPFMPWAFKARAAGN